MDELRNLLIPGSSDRRTNLDFFALNIQRAKDHGLLTTTKYANHWGDYFLFEKTFPLSVVAENFETGFSDVIMRNTNVIGLQENIFLLR